MAKKAKAEKTEVIEPVVEKSKQKLSAQEKKNQSKKIGFVVTYVVALLSLLAGLLVPLYSHGIEGEVMDKMLIRYVPGMLNTAVSAFGMGPIFGELPWFISTFGSGDIYSVVCAYLGLLYTVVCVLAIVMLIPVCAGKNNKHTSVGCALFVEIFALLILSVWISFTYYDSVIVQGLDAYATLDASLMIAFGVTLFMAIVQSIDSKNGIGISKVFAVLLSLLSIVLLLDVSTLIPALRDVINDASGHVGATAGFISGIEAMGQPFGIYSIHQLVNIILGFITGDFTALNTMMTGTENVLVPVANIFVIILTVLILFNFIVDIIGLGTGKKFKKDRSPAGNRASNIFALVRYTLTLVIALVLIVFTFVDETLTAGLLLYALAIAVALQFVNALFRTLAALKRLKKGIPAPAEKNESVVINDTTFIPEETAVAATETAPVTETAYEPAPATYQTNLFGETVTAQETVAPQPAPIAEPAPQPQVSTDEQISFATFDEPAPAAFAPITPVAEEQPHTVYIYGGETDAFMETLTDAEKMEFVEMFVKKTKGSVKGVPDYKMNEENEEFFPAVFVHINRYRAMCSDALLSKMYKQLGKIM